MINQIEVTRRIREAQSRKYKVCVFGAGLIGTGDGIRYLHLLDVVPDFYCDSSEEKQGLIFGNDLLCYSPDYLKQMEDVVVFVLVTKCHVDSILSALNDLDVSRYVLYDELLLSDYAVEYFLSKPDQVFMKADMVPYRDDYHIENEGQKRIAIYTCITGNYDSPKEPLITSPECDYYCITDNAELNSSVWRRLDIQNFIPEGISDNTRRSRYCKIMGCEIFNQYPFSIFIDGNIQIIKDISKYVDLLACGRIGLNGFPIVDMDCTYSHGVSLADRKDDASVIRQQLKRYKNDGFPRHYGLFETNIVARNNRDEQIKTIMRQWWQEVYQNSRRDQLSLFYLLWKNGFVKNDIVVLNNKVRASDDVLFFSHDK